MESQKSSKLSSHDMQQRILALESQIDNIQLLVQRYRSIEVSSTLQTIMPPEVSLKRSHLHENSATSSILQLRKLKQRI